MMIMNETKWVIMNKYRTVIAKGVPRNRYLVPLSDKTDKKRVLYYDSKKKVESAFTVSGFYGNFDPSTPDQDDYKLEAVEVTITIQTKG